MRLLAPALLLALAACKDRTKFIPPPDAGPICEDPTRQLVNGECRFVCQRDGDCMAGERCNLFSGQCEPKPPPPDAGPVAGLCTTGAVRCSADRKAIETCSAGDPPTWVTSTTCPSPNGFCQNERCLSCQPGAATCSSMTQLQRCLDDGSATRTVTCSGAATCQSNECRECAPNAYRCSPSGATVQQCLRTADESAQWRWANVGDNFDGSCITGMCRVGGANGFECVPPVCFPGQIQCLNSSTAQTCNMTGGWTNVPCGPTAECQAGVCVDECADAVAAKSYFGCDYWTAVQDNTVHAPLFKGNTSSGMGTSDSRYALVVANRSVNAATVTVTRYTTAPVPVKTVVVPGRNDMATRGLMVIYLPWQSIGADIDTAGVSGLRRYGYRLQSTKPITVYQFNPLDAVVRQGACTSASNCTAQPAAFSPQCVNSVCNYFSYSNDASLLLPAHILGLDYFAMTPEHIISRLNNASGAPTTVDNPFSPSFGMPLYFNSSVTIVATQDNTVVDVRSNARTRAGPGVVAIAKGGMQSFTLNSYDVLQIASDNPANVNMGTQANLECAPDPYDSPLCGLPFQGPCHVLCRTDNTLTGSFIRANKPVAVFGGSKCTLRGYVDTACDHVEEQLFPFTTWGKSFVAVRTPPLRLANNQFASGANAGPDYYQILAGCPTSQCPQGTLITLSPAPAAGDVLLPNRCASGTLAGNNCRLAGGQYMEFRSRSSFTITADQPILVGQFFAGQNATTGSSPPAQGDPSFVLLPPIEQWRSNYTVLTAPGTRDNYVGLVMDSAKVMAVHVDGQPVSGWAPIGSTPFRNVNVPVSQGTHVITVIPQAGQMTVPGAGVLVFGFDQYVSYGYTGGLDLQSIVTGINPGG